MNYLDYLIKPSDFTSGTDKKINKNKVYTVKSAKCTADNKGLKFGKDAFFDKADSFWEDEPAPFEIYENMAAAEAEIKVNNSNAKKREPIFKEPTFFDSVSYTKILEPVLSSYVVFDLETTGLSKKSDSILEIGAIKVIDDEETEKFSTLINPRFKIPYHIVQLCGITDEMVKAAPTLDKAVTDFLSFTEGLPLVAHNASFDMGFLTYNMAKIGRNDTLCAADTLLLSRRYNKECKKHNLGYLTHFFNITLDNAHRAYFDALATNKLYQIIKKKYLAYSQTISELKPTDI